MSPPMIVADPNYGRLKRLVIEHTGLAYYADKDNDFAARISHRLSARGVRDCASYLRLLDGGSPGAEEMDALIAELTIGETYFFRQVEHFDALRDTILPEMLERNRLTRRLRIWSAGCANGAEPYSIALVIREALGDSAASWNIRILGTDINRRYLAEAEAGRFGQWSFREEPERLRSRYFRREGKEWVIAPQAKTWVSFRYHNLVSDPIPPAGEAPGFDLIFCRNVMIYFTQELIRATAARLYDALAEGGWLVVGHAEPNADNFRPFQAVMASGITLYRKLETRQPQAAPAPVEPPQLPPLPPQAAAVARPAAQPRPEPRRQPAQAPTVEEVRRLADRGQWRSAASCAQKLVEANGLNPAAHFMLALVLEHTASPIQAVQSLRRAIYLDRAFVMAHYHLGLILERQRDARRARRAFENVLELLGSRAPADLIEHGDGISAAELRDLAKMHLELLNKQ
jgi:chemotaxis protein methyltransferase CheR